MEKPRRRWLRFSLKACLLAMLVSGAFFAGWGGGRNAGRQIVFIDGRDSAKTADDVKKSLWFVQQWKETQFAGRKYLFGITRQGYGESYIDLRGWIFSRHSREWRRILVVRTRNVGNAELLVDTDKGVLALRGAANNELRSVDVFRFDLRATSDDASYAR